MADEGGSGEKSQAPTAHRLRKAREEGNIAQSREFVLLISLGAFILVFMATAGNSAKNFTAAVQRIIIHFGEVSDDSSSIYNFGWQIAKCGLNLGLPLMAAGASTTLVFGLLQTGFLFRPEALTPDLKRLSPMKGIKRTFSVNNLVELLKSLVKIAIFGCILYGVALETIRISPESERWSSLHLASELEHWFIYSTLLVLGIQCIIALADDLWTRYHRMSKLKMSFQDIKDEVKQTDGDPYVKSRMRQIRTRRSRRRMMKAVKESTVVVVNPTHYAVALLYSKTSGGAPQIVAKGMDDLAARIRETAGEAKVPVVSNPPLARSLYKLPLDTEIPEEFWKPVAAIIAYVVKLKTPKRMHKP